MRTIHVPKFLNEVLGQRQYLSDILLIGIFAIPATGLITSHFWNELSNLPLWRIVVVILLVADIFAGCIANFTKGTSSFYATRKSHRWAFIIIHFHTVILGLLLYNSIENSVWIIWAYSIICATITNLDILCTNQKTYGGLFLSAGVFLVIYLTWSSHLLQIMSALFLVKVVYSFSIDHYFDSKNETKLVS